MLETLPPDELPAVPSIDPGRCDRDTAGRFLPGNSLAQNARHRAGRNGALTKLEAKGDPSWQASNRYARRWAAQCRSELTRLYGSLSSDVCAFVEDAAEAAADARWARAKAAELEASDPERADALRREARELRIEARGHRMAAREYAAKGAGAPGAVRRTGRAALEARIAARKAAEEPSA